MFGLGGTKIYAVYIDPDDDAPHETAEFVEEHATIWGFVFHAFWCFYHKLWWHGLAVLALWMLFVVAGTELGLGTLAAAACELVIRLIVAFDGNSWRQARLQRKGYILSDIAAGESELAAKQRFYQRWLAQSPSA